MLDKIRISLLRGVCQTPAYLAYQRGFFADEGLEVEINIPATAWLVPEQLENGDSQFGVIPWTRVAAAASGGKAPLKVICGSGHEEAALVVRTGLDTAEVGRIAVPKEGGIKDLTAMGLIESMGWSGVPQLRFPSGDGAILSFIGGGADAAAMVEPWATMLEVLEMGRVVRRTGDLWPSAPGCSLSASSDYLEQEPEIAQRVVNAYLRGAALVDADPAAAAAAAEPYIGISADIIERALGANKPRVDAIRSRDAMAEILELMQKLRYVDERPRGYTDLRFLDAAQGLSSVESGSS